MYWTMSKKTITLAPDWSPGNSRKTLLPVASICVLAALSAPLIKETMALCYSGWCNVLDRPITVRTPILDAIGEGIQTAQQEITNTITPHFNRVPWNPQVVLAAAVVVMTLAMVMLRR
jgi:hypothetical protein